jgi:hypothetical protein
VNMKTKSICVETPAISERMDSSKEHIASIFRVKGKPNWDYRILRRVSYLLFNPDDGSNMSLPNVGILRIYTVS